MANNNWLCLRRKCRPVQLWASECNKIQDPTVGSVTSGN